MTKILISLSFHKTYNEIRNKVHNIHNPDLPPISDIIWGIGFTKTKNNFSWQIV